MDRTPTRTTHLCTYKVIRTLPAQVFHSPLEHAWFKGQHGSGWHCGVSQKIPSSQRHVSHVAALDTEHFYTICFTYLTYLPTFYLPHCPELDQETLRDSWRSGGYTKSASPTDHEPKLIQSDDFEPRRNELDRNLWTDLQPRRTELDARNIGADRYQIPERILGNDYQNPITEDTKETGKVGADMHHIKTRIYSDYNSAESIADSDLEDGELRKMLASLLYVCTWARRK